MKLILIASILALSTTAMSQSLKIPSYVETDECPASYKEYRSCRNGEWKGLSGKTLRSTFILCVSERSSKALVIHDHGIHDTGLYMQKAVDVETDKKSTTVTLINAEGRASGFLSFVSNNEVRYSEHNHSAYLKNCK